VTRFSDERVCVIQGATWAGVCGVRVTPAEVEELLEETRQLIPAGKTTTWWLDPGARPRDLNERLVALGLRGPADRAGLLHALVCVTPPPAGPADVVVGRVETFPDFVAATELVWDAFSTPHARREAERPHLRTQHDAAVRAGVPVTFLATVDGRAAGAGRSVYSEYGSFLIAGAVAPWARHRGVYRALVRARWDDAVARGAAALVTEAMPGTSYPILLRLGFEEVCTIRRLEDPRKR